MTHRLAIRAALANNREWQAVWEQDRRNQQSREEQPNMPKGKLTPQKDQRRRKPDVDPIKNDLNDLYRRAGETLEAATLAGQRQAAIDAAASEQVRDRFSSAGVDES